MCGIIGFNWSSKKDLENSLNFLTHRGPDNIGYYCDGFVSLGHTRLSVIDLTAAGNQPMTYNHQGKLFIIVYNGEVYNFRELKKNSYKRDMNLKPNLTLK